MKPPSARTPFALLPHANQAAILCNTGLFQEFAAKRCGYPDKAMTPSAAAEYVRTVCGVTSRKQLDSNSKAAGQFQALRTEYDEWRGRIPTRRP